MPSTIAKPVTTPESSTTNNTKMSVERMKFSDLNGSVETTTFGSRRRGCQVSIVSGFILALLAVASAVGVGLIVHFATSGRTVQCHCNYSPGLTVNTSLAVRPSKAQAHSGGQQALGGEDPDRLWDACLTLVATKNECRYTCHISMFYYPPEVASMKYCCFGVKILRSQYTPLPLY